MTNSLLGRSKGCILPTIPNTSDKQLADQFNSFFIEKTQKVCNNLNPIGTCVTEHSIHLLPLSFSTFTYVTDTNLSKLINGMPAKSCQLDPIPTKILKLVSSATLPVIASIVNGSLSTGEFPNILKRGIIKPLLKKPSLDPNMMSHYRPVTNIAFISKIIEKVVADELMHFVDENNLFELFQSAYRKLHSTETTILKIHNDIMTSIDEGKCVLLVLLDLSAAFDTIDHAILLSRLASFGIGGIVLQWFKSYLCGRQQAVYINGVLSTYINVECGVPQGSILGPILFSLYVNPVGDIIRRYGTHFHMYADDTQLYLSFKPNDDSCVEAITTLQTCINDVNTWFENNMLCLNGDKTQVLYCTSIQSGEVTFQPLIHSQLAMLMLHHLS